MTKRVVGFLGIVIISIFFTSCVNLFSVFTPKEASQTGDPNELVALGQYYMQQMQYEKAYEVYSKVLTIDGNNALALEGAGAAYFYVNVGSTNVMKAALALASSNVAGDTNADAMNVFSPYIDVQKLYKAFSYMSGNYAKIVTGQADNSLSSNDSAVTLFYLVSAAVDTTFQLVDLDGDGIITNDSDDFVTFTNLNPFVLDGSSNTSISGVPLLFESSALSITNDLNALVDGLTNGTNSMIARTNEYISVISNRMFSNFYALFTNGELNITNDMMSATNLLGKITNEIGPITNSLIPQVSNVISNTLDQTNTLASNMNTRIESISNWVTNRQASISNWVIAKTNEAMSNVAALTNDLSTNADNLNSSIQNFTNDINTFTNDVTVYLTNTHTNILFDSWKAASILSTRKSLDSNYTSVTNSLDDLTNKINALPQDVTNLVDSNVTEVNDYVDSNYTDVTNYIETNITDSTNYLHSEINRITNQLRTDMTNLISTNLKPVLDDVVILVSNIDNITNGLGNLTNRLNEILTNDAYTMISNFMNQDLPDILMPYLNDFLSNEPTYSSMLSNPGTALLFKLPDVQRRLTNRLSIIKKIATNLMLSLQSSNIKSSLSAVVDPILAPDSALNYIADPVSYFTSTNSSMTDALMLGVTTNLLQTIFGSTNDSPTVAQRDTMFKDLFKNALPALSSTLTSNIDLNDMLSNVDLSSMLSNVDVDSYFTNPDISNYLSYTNMDILMDQYFSNSMTNVDLNSVFDTVESNLNIVRSNMSDTNDLIKVDSSSLLSNVDYPSNVSTPSGMDSGYTDAANMMSNVNQFSYIEPFHTNGLNVTSSYESNVVIIFTNEGMTTVEALYKAITNRDTGFSVNTADGISQTETNQIIQRSIEIMTNGYEDLTNVNLLIDVMTNTYNVNNFLWTAVMRQDIQSGYPDLLLIRSLPAFYKREDCLLTVLG